MKGCGWNNHKGHGQYRSGCPYCEAVAGAVRRSNDLLHEALQLVDDLIDDTYDEATEANNHEYRELREIGNDLKRRRLALNR
jgi:hypothetical protein